MYRIDWADEASPYSLERDDGQNGFSSDEEHLPPTLIRCVVCHSLFAIVLCCLFTTDLGGALKKAHSIDGLPVIGIDETVHDMPAHEDPLDEPFTRDNNLVFQESLNVLCEDDIIGVRASIVYENCLRQLATFLIILFSVGSSN